MNFLEKEFSFCTLALGKKYRDFTKQLAGDLDRYSPGTKLVVYTDNPSDFRDKQNVLAFKHRQQGILYCYHDKRFVMEKALSMFPVAINIDADTRIVDDVPKQLEFTPGINARHQNMMAHVSKYRPQSIELIKTVANKLNIIVDDAQFIGESMYVITRDGGREKEFFKYWGTIGNYFEMNGMFSGEGNAMGLAAARVGWTINRSEGWENINKIRKHLDASYGRKHLPFWHLEDLKQRFAYHYRLNKTRLAALSDFDFFYR